MTHTYSYSDVDLRASIFRFASFTWIRWSSKPNALRYPHVQIAELAKRQLIKWTCIQINRFPPKLWSGKTSSVNAEWPANFGDCRNLNSVQLQGTSILMRFFRFTGEQQRWRIVGHGMRLLIRVKLWRATIFFRSYR